MAVLLIGVPLELLWRIENLFITDLLLLFLFFVFILWRERQFKTLTVLMVICVLIASTYSATGAMRHHSDNIAGRIALTGKLIATKFFAPGDAEINIRGRVIRRDPRITPLVDRIGQIWFFQMVYDRSPDPVPYWGGHTYKQIFTSFVPRAIYPNKPEERAGGEFGFRYGILLLRNSRTSINIPWLTELLANYGTAGVLIGMAIFGVFLAFLDKTFNARGMSEPEFLVGLTLIFPLVYPESNFTVMTSSMLPLFVAFWLYFTFGGKLLGWSRSFR